MISAVIFDLDGTVIDNEGIWEGVFKEIAQLNNIQSPIINGQWIHVPGIGITNNWKKIVKEEEVVRKLAQQTRDRYQELRILSEPKVRVGFEELVETIKERGFLTGLATSSNWDMVADEIEKLNLILAFDVTTTGEEVTEFKPDPEIYLYTCQKLGIDPSQALVIEDSLAGAVSGLDAGCQVVGITSDYAPEDALKAVGVKHTVANLEEVVLILAEYGNSHQENDSPQTNNEES